MSDDKRPGGLTALAVVNFIFCGLGLLAVLTLVALLPLLEGVPNLSEQQRGVVAALDSLGTAPFVATIAAELIGSVLLLVSGIGYLKQKRFLGRTMGNVYAVFALVTTVPTALWLPVPLGGGFNISTILGFVYPILTLLLVNLTFKEDLVN